MEKNIAGEIFLTDILPEWIRFETFPNCVEGTEVIIAYPNIHTKVVEDAVQRLEGSDSKKKQLSLYGFGDGHFPASNTSIAQLVKIFTKKHWDVSVEIDDDASLDNILAALNKYVKENKERIASYFEEHYDTISANKQKKIIENYIRAEMKSEMRNTIQGKITSFFAEGNTQQGIGISISTTNQDAISAFVVEKINIMVDKEMIEEKVKALYDCNLDLRPVRQVFLLLAENYPESISKRIIKESVMSSNDNMKAIGCAVDKKISVFAKTLAVRSKSDIAKYETGNMLMVLGVDSDSTRGFCADFFFPKNDL